MGNVRYKGDNYTRSNLSSGSNVVPNPEGEATETLNKIGIDDTIYDFPKELPEVTSADEGDVLAVNANGEWAKASPSGGEMIVTCSVGSLVAGQTIGDMSESVENVVQAVQQGKNVKLLMHITNSSNYIQLYPSSLTNLTNFKSIVFIGGAADASTITIYAVQWNQSLCQLRIKYLS